MGLIAWSFFSIWICIIATPAFATQVPFSHHDHVATSATTPTSNNPWDLDSPTPPNLNSTDNLIFDTIHSLLQHWPNTRYRNGHNLVPGHIPVGTLLYHGRSIPKVPDGPDWVAVDPEHSYMFARSWKPRFPQPQPSPPPQQQPGGPSGEETEIPLEELGSNGWHLTLVTTRPLQVLYFDGSSAAKMAYGSMDSQDIVTWGKVLPEWAFNEIARIKGLCDWSRRNKLGIDGFVRMEMDFEIMLCDFTSQGGVEVVSFLNVDNKEGIPGDGQSPNNYWSGNNTQDGSFAPGKMSKNMPVILAGHWHNRFPGETRIQLDLSRLVSFYDTSLAPSLIESRYGVERYFHRLLNISDADIARVMSKLEKNVLATTTTAKGANIDWQALFRVIVDRFAKNLEMLEYTLFNQTSSSSSSSTSPVTILNTTMAMNQAYDLLTVSLRPYVVSSVHPDTSGSLQWAESVYQWCATTHVKFLSSVDLTDSETLLLSAAKGVNKEICRTLTRMWAQFPYQEADNRPLRLGSLLDEWKAETRRLMKWLDWSVWVKCRPECTFEEECYLPTWPYFGWHRNGPRKGPRPSTKSIEEDDEDWMRPTPRCVRRLPLL